MGQEKQALLRSIRAYVPDLVARRAIAAPCTPLTWQEEWIAAALLFADISGFTAMSETLARLGKEGAEELTRVLNAYFTAMIHLVHSYGGHVVKFGGDALTCAFANPRISKWQPKVASNQQICDLQTEVLRACACALAMQEKMAVFRAVETRGGSFELRMKIGISAGSVLSLSVGKPQEGLEYVLAGRPLDRMALAEHQAAAGEVLIDGKWVASAGVGRGDLGIIVGEGREGFLAVHGLARPVKKAEKDDVDWDALTGARAEQAVTRLVPYLPPTVYEQIVEGQREFVGEHRRVVSLFVNFFGLDYDADLEAGWKLQQYFTAMQDIIHRYGGRLNQVITGDKGSLLHLIFGAPVAHEDDEERALGCALEMQRNALELDSVPSERPFIEGGVPSEWPFREDGAPSEWLSRESGLPFITDQRIGIASGYVFAGNVGSAGRREYTVMGDTVNLSARLMQAAGSGEILLDRDTAHRAEEAFVCDELAPVRVKWGSPQKLYHLRLCLL